MAITYGMLRSIRDLIIGESVDDDWLMSHIDIAFLENGNIIINIDDLNEQEYQWLKDEI